MSPELIWMNHNRLHKVQSKEPPMWIIQKVHHSLYRMRLNETTYEYSSHRTRLECVRYYEGPGFKDRVKTYIKYLFDYRR